MPDVNLDGFRNALKAAILGPDKENIKWTSEKYTFNIEKTNIKRTATGIEVDGSNGEHISHRRTWRPDDRIYYRIEISNDGSIDIDMNKKSSWSILAGWFRKVAGVLLMVSQAYDAMTQPEKGELGEARKELRQELDTGRASSVSREAFLAKATPSMWSENLLDDDWESQVEFLIANIAHYVALLYLPDIADNAQPIPDSGVLSGLVADFKTYKANLTVVDR